MVKVRYVKITKFQLGQVLWDRWSNTFLLS